MKKLLLSTALLLSTFAIAQLQLRETRFGVIAGPDYSRVKNAHNPSSARISFFAGAFALTPLDHEDQFFLQTQVEYLQAGEKGKGATTYSNNYISVPIYLKAYFSEAESEFFGQLGPRFAFLINQEVKEPNRAVYNIAQEGKSATFDFAISAGIGFSYKRKWEATLRYDWGFSNAYPDLKETRINDPASKKNKPQHVVLGGISYIFD